MRKTRFSDEQIIGILKEHQAGLGPVELCRKHGIRDATLYKWRSRFGGMEMSDAMRLRALEEENGKLKRLLADAMLDVSTLRSGQAGGQHAEKQAARDDERTPPLRLSPVVIAR